MNQPVEEGSDRVISHDQLPLPDFDHLPLGSLTERIRTLEADDLERLLHYEREHGNRLPVLQVMEARLEQLRAGAEPSGGSPFGETPEKSPGASAPQQMDATTEAPSLNPPFHGVPTNAAQDRSRQD